MAMLATTIRQLVEGVDRRDLSNEEYAALKADEILRGQLSIAQRLTIQGLILATSFGQGGKLPYPSYNRNYRPTTNLEKILAFADVNGLDLEFDEWVEENFAIIRENRGIGVKEDFDWWIQGRLGFLQYLQDKLNDVKGILPEALGAGLQSKLTGLVETFNSLKSHDCELRDGYSRRFFELVKSFDGR